MDVTISAETFSDLFTSPLWIALFIWVVVSLSIAATSIVMSSGVWADVLTLSSIILTAGVVIWAVHDVESQKREVVDTTLATISDQYEISDLTKSGEEHIEACTPGSTADREPYSWFSESPKALHEGVLVKTAEVDGSCSYTLYSRSLVTPVTG